MKFIKRRSKFNVDMTKSGKKKRTIDNYTFDSQTEADYYLYLKELQKQKIVKDIEVQPKFILQDKFEKNGKKYLPITYKADFTVTYFDGHVEIIDIKGLITPEFKLKRKIFEYKFSDKELICLQFSKIDGGWITIEDLEIARKQRKKEKEIARKDK